MIIRYKIVEVWPQDHLIVVRFWTDKISEEEIVYSRDENGNITRCRSDVSISIPIPEPSEEELKKLILSKVPTDFLKTLEAVKDDTIDTSLSTATTLLNIESEISANAIVEMLQPAPSQVDSEVPISSLTDEEIAAILESSSTSSS
jgi:hypothetical protein